MPVKALVEIALTLRYLYLQSYHKKETIADDTNFVNMTSGNEEDQDGLEAMPNAATRD